LNTLNTSERNHPVRRRRWIEATIPGNSARLALFQTAFTQCFQLGSLLSANYHRLTAVPTLRTHQAVHGHTLVSCVVIPFRRVLLVGNMTVSQLSISVRSIGLQGTYKLTESLILQHLVYRYLWALAVMLPCQVQLRFFLSLFRNKIVCAFLVSPLCRKTRPPNTVQLTVHDTKPICMHFCFSLYFFLCKTQPDCLSRCNWWATGWKSEEFGSIPD